MGMLAGKVVVVTGAGRGVGRALAIGAAAEGAQVIVNDYGVTLDGSGTDRGPANDVVGEIRAAGGKAEASIADITNPQSAASIIEDAIRQFGHIDAVVNNAGFLRDGMFFKMSQKDWADIIDVHLNGYFHVARAAAPYFKEQKSGSYVHFTSTTGLLANVGQANYAAAKAGVVGLSTSIAIDMQRYGVRSNCIAPTAWSRLIGTIPTETEAQRARVEKIKQMTPEKISPLVTYLCSDEAADVSGQVFGVRKNEIFLYARPTILRTMQMSDGWTPQSCAEILIPALRPSFHPLRQSAELLPWDPQ